MSVEVKPKVENGQLFKWERTHTKQVQKWFWFVTFQVFFVSFHSEEFSLMQ